MLNIYQKYCLETFHQGQLYRFEPMYEEDFNFAYDVVDVLGKKCPSKRAMLWCDDKGHEHTFTFEDMSKQSTRAANFFTSLGIKKGDKVMLILKRHYEYWFAVLGLHKIGAVAVPASNMLKEKDLIYRFEAAHITSILCTCDGDVIENVDSALKKCDFIKNKICIHGEREGWLNFNKGIARKPAEMERIKTAAVDPMILYFTSGTTGLPKMVYHDFTYAIAHIVTAKYWHDIDPDGLHLTISDTGWMKSMWGKLYGQWFLEGGIFVCDFDRFDPSIILPLFAKYQITSFCAPPTMFRFFIREDLDSYDLSSLKSATIAGEALNPEVYHKFFQSTGLKLREAFGQSETTAILLNPPGRDPKPGSMGKPSPAYDVALVDPEGNDVETGSIGEVVLRVGDKRPCGMFCGYYQDKQRTAEVWYDGLYHTGDTAWRDEDGFYWYVGRTDDIIKSSGYRIGPFEIESVLMELPYVLECAITGVPDPVRGQIIKATIVLTGDKEGSDELAAEIQKYVKKQTAPYKYPRIVEFVKELPKTTSGKIRRKQIRDEH